MATEEKKRIFTKVPAPVNALGLGLACLASATAEFSQVLAIPLLLNWAWILITLAIIPLALYLLKIILNFPAFKGDLKHPIFTCIVPAFAMALMIEAHFLGLIDTISGMVLWFVAVGVHIVFTITFLYNVIKGFKWENFTPAYYIAPVGIVVAVVCSEGFVTTLGADFTLLNEAIFWYGFLWYIGLLPAMILRLLGRSIPGPKKPSAIIMAAPPNLLVAAYVTLGAQGVTIQPMFILILVGFSILTTLWVYILLGWKLLRIKFNPEFASYTFPTVIGSVAMLKYASYLGMQGNALPTTFNLFGVINFYISTAIVLYVAICFLYFLVIKPRMKK